MLVVGGILPPMPIDGVERFPLHWPANWTRTPGHERQPSRYKVGGGRALNDLLYSLKQMGAVDVIVSTNVELLQDGLPYANRREPQDPGVAVYWLKDKKPQVMACDHWEKVHENIRAIGLALEAMRALERSGATQVFDRAFAGFAALPAHGHQKHWREVLGVSDEMSVDRPLIERLWRELARIHHPDREGNDRRMAELNVARDAALREYP
jgi:hypothetical protein